MSLSRISARLTSLRVVGAIGLLIAVAALSFWQPLAAQDANALLQRALAAVRNADAFTVEMGYTQRQAGLVAGRDNVLELTIRGQVERGGKARFTFSAPFAQGGRGDDAHEYLLADGLVYQRAGEQWQRVDELPASPQMAEGGLSLAAAASNVTLLPALETETGRYQGIAFTLAAEDVLRFLLAQGGSLTPETLALARLDAPRMEGTGELWVDPAGLPSRLILDLSMQKAGEPTPTVVHTVANYSGFGVAFPPGTFDPTASAATSLPLPEKHWERYAPPLAALLLTALGLGFVMLLFVRRRWATQAVTALVLAGLLAPSLHGTAQAVQSQRKPAAVAEASTPPGAALAQLLDETRALSNQLQSGLGPAFQLAENSDYDFDGIPNGVELQLGTNPFVADTDQDGLTDYQEINGFYCGNNIWVETDPLNPDSNGDGVNDGAEFHGGQCSSGGSNVPNAWNDDNDGDGVPDWLDLSPFTASGMLAGEKKAGPSFTFETLDQNPGGETNPYPYYVDLQIRPFGGSSLQYAYKKLHWPFDKEGPIQAAFQLGPGAGSSGEIQLVPFLEVQVQCQDLPRESTMQEYGIQATALGNAQCPHAHAPYAMQIPLLPVEEGGIVHAFQARVLHDDFAPKLGNQTLLMQRWQDVRLKWVVQADISLLNDEGMPEVSDSGYYGLMVYEEAFQITGLQVTRQGGVSMLAAANIPAPGVPHDVDTTDAPMSLLRAGLESQFLGGNLNLTLFKNIFNDPSSASSESRWGIAEKFRVHYDSSMDYEHMDEAVDDLASRVTPGLLSKLYSGGLSNIEPTLVLASEQRTSVVNLDELGVSDFNQIVVNTCLNPLVTSRSLKLQKYKLGVGGQFAQWYPLSLDQVLQRLDKKMPNYAVPFAGRTLAGHNLLEDAAAHNITKLATTAWFMGQTAIRAVGDKEFQKVGMDAAAVAAALLDENGLLPESYTDAIAALLDVFEAGGPVAWLQQQWNLTVGIVQGVEDFVGSFLDWTPSLTMPGEATFLSWTHTAINALNFLALVTGEKIFGQVASILTTIIEVYRTVRVIIDTITAAVDAAANGVSAVLTVIAQELASLTNSLSVVGMIFNIAITWLSLAAVIGDLPPGLAAVAISKAIVDTVIYVVIFAIAAAIPLVGVIIAVVFMLIKALSELVGEPLTPFDLTATFFADLFAPKLEGHVYMVGQNWTNVNFKAVKPLGGFVEKRTFAIEVQSTVTLQGRTDLMDDSYIFVVLGQQLYTKWKSAGSLSTGTPGKQWPFSAEQIGWATNPLVPVDMPLEYKVSQQEHVSSARMNINPWYPMRNATIIVSMVLDAQLAQLWDDTVHVQKFYCGDGCWEQGTAPQPPLGGWEPSGPIVIGPMKFDVLPATLYSFWNWDELENNDIDGDGLWGYKQPDTGQLIGPDVNLCPGQTGIPSVYNIDSDGDGLSDAFELATPGLDPCKKDSDGDGLDDRKELRLGTNPAVADTDGDGRSDGEEVARWISGELLPPWRVELKNASSLFSKNPAAFPNPRQANLDGDHRNDSEEWAKKSSPNARNVKDGDEYPFPISVSTLGAAAPNQALIVMQALAETTEIGLSPTLVITLPTASADATVQLDLLPTLGNAGLDTVTPLPGGVPNVLVYQLPPLLPGRGLVAHVNGPAGAPDGLAGLEVAVAYDQGGRHWQQQRTLQPVGRSRLLTTITEPFEGALLAAPVTIQGATRGMPGATAVYVCITTAATCGENQYALAEGVERWSFPFAPAADGAHRIFAYAANDLGGRSPVAGPVTVHVDRTPPASLAIDLTNGLALSTTAVVDGLPALTLPLRASDSGGAGLAHVAVSDSQGRTETVDISPARQGDASFQLLWPLPGFSRGEAASVLSTQFISLTLTAVDGAGNSAGTTTPVRLLVDDIPPALEATLPVVIDGGTLWVSGHADDRRHEPGARQPYSNTRSAGDAATRLTLGGVSDFATIVGDMNGDGLDEVVWVQPATATTPLQAALFFGHPALPATLALADADVRFSGQAAGTSPYPPVVANAGDVNGDGLDDLLIGDPSARRGAGTVYLLLGRPASDWFSPFALANANRSFAPAGVTAFGASLAGAG
ncbi:MAG: FG-GAP repeat protein, partial [Caldilineaceae bacterium]|nr:FG-GAP repeat protein [Caldilineaceae bacterium]